eukprot:scaffold153968_cov22-Prasinocladus_malaysianus.AAC.3
MIKPEQRLRSAIFLSHTFISVLAAGSSHAVMGKVLSIILGASKENQLQQRAITTTSMKMDLRALKGFALGRINYPVCIMTTSKAIQEEAFQQFF